MWSMLQLYCQFTCMRLSQKLMQGTYQLTLKHWMQLKPQLLDKYRSIECCSCDFYLKLKPGSVGWYSGIERSWCVNKMLKLKVAEISWSVIKEKCVKFRNTLRKNNWKQLNCQLRSERWKQLKCQFISQPGKQIYLTPEGSWSVSEGVWVNTIRKLLKCFKMFILCIRICAFQLECLREMKW